MSWGERGDVFASLHLRWERGTYSFALRCERKEKAVNWVGQLSHPGGQNRIHLRFDKKRNFTGAVDPSLVQIGISTRYSWAAYTSLAYGEVKKITATSWKVLEKEGENSKTFVLDLWLRRSRAYWLIWQLTQLELNLRLARLGSQHLSWTHMYRWCGDPFHLMTKLRFFAWRWKVSGGVEGDFKAEEGKRSGEPMILRPRARGKSLSILHSAAWSFFSAQEVDFAQ